ncbi:MAG: molybdenum cofactor guanylyltransferase MobA [Rhodospirillaceae bacterium]|nr:MAG: molybdenum cofactor guanylyltransferase MobA [Rhodospirillaceae bacterium]
MTSNLPEIVGVLLAGGQARRMGGREKYLLPLQGRPLLAHVIERARSQVTSLLLNAAGDPDRLSGFGLPIACDVVEGHAGPLAGVLTGMEWALQNAPQCRWIATFATDTPFFPTDLVHHLWAAVEAEESDLARATSAGRPHPVFGLWPVALAPDLRHALTEEGASKIATWTARYRTVDVNFPTEPMDPFFNINQPQDLTRLEALLEKAGKKMQA